MIIRTNCKVYEENSLFSQVLYQSIARDRIRGIAGCWTLAQASNRGTLKTALWVLITAAEILQSWNRHLSTKLLPQENITAGTLYWCRRPRNWYLGTGTCAGLLMKLKQRWARRKMSWMEYHEYFTLTGLQTHHSPPDHVTLQGTLLWAPISFTKMIIKLFILFLPKGWGTSSPGAKCGPLDFSAWPLGPSLGHALLEFFLTQISLT